MNIGTELLIIFVLILLNGFFAMAEMAVVSSRRARLKQRANEGSFRYQQVLKTADHPTRFLSTIQIAITLIGTLSGTIGGATIADGFSQLFGSIPSLAPYKGLLSIGLVVVIITFLSAVFGELIPKRIALVNPETISAFSIIPVRVISSIFYPFVLLFSAVTDLFLRIIGLKDKHGPSVTEEEIHIMMQQGADEGVFNESEKDMVQGVLELSSQRIGTYMTHRVDMVAIEDGSSAAEVMDLIIRYPHFSQFPVRRGGMDRIIGVIISKQVLVEHYQRKDFRLRNLIHKPVFLPESMESLKALEVIRSTPGRVAFIMDEYGGVEGMVSLSDITDAVFGVIASHARLRPEPIIKSLPDGSWLVDGELDADEFLESFAIRTGLPTHRFHTVAGLILEIIGCLPVDGQSVEWEGLVLRVEAMEGRRIARVLVRKIVNS